ncbi:hypothetical protein B0H14DRAFT_3003769 [Mycena olivaceomarginata]|nr:hypothetical protein B0H14DRAFT_3003769 [Mycena olivaceomarginata]
MFNKVALFFCTLVASSVLAGECTSFCAGEPQTSTAPIPDIGNDVFQQCLDAGGDDFTCAQEADAPPTCNKDLITSNLAELKSTATGIQNIGPVPDPLAANQGGATLTAILAAIDTATKANAAGDFATVASSLQTVVDKTGTAIGSLIADGGESGADLTILDESGDTVTLAQLCASA